MHSGRLPPGRCRARALPPHEGAYLEGGRPHAVLRSAVCAARRTRAEFPVAFPRPRRGAEWPPPLSAARLLTRDLHRHRRRYPAARGKSRHRAWVVGYGPLGCSLGYRGRPLGGMLEAVLRPRGGRLGASLGPLLGLLGASWVVLGASRRPLGASWVFAGSLQGALQGIAGVLQGLCRVFAGSLQGYCRVFAGGLCRVFAGSLQGLCRVFAGGDAVGYLRPGGWGGP